jgi:hypothetical protein
VISASRLPQCEEEKSLGALLRQCVRAEHGAFLCKVMSKSPRRGLFTRAPVPPLGRSVLTVETQQPVIREQSSDDTLVFHQVFRKRLTNTPVRQAGSVLKCPDDRKNRVVSAQATYPCGSSAVGGRVCEQRYAAERVLPESRFELQHSGSPSKETALEEKA